MNNEQPNPKPVNRFTGEVDSPITKVNILKMACQRFQNGRSKFNHPCVMAITRALNEIEGIKNVKVDLAKGEADFDEVKTSDIDLVRKAIRKAGYAK